MKPALLTLSFLLFAFTTKLPLAFSAGQVQEASGDPVFADHKLYILPVVGSNSKTSGGLKLGKTGQSTCPATVLLQEYFVIGHGMQIIFRMPGISIGPGEIYLGTRLDVEFAKESDCAESSQWMVFVDSDIQKTCVGIGGDKDHPGKKTMTGKFYIEEYKQNYKLGFCPSGSSNCSDIGSYDNKENAMRLYLTDHEPLEIQFASIVLDG